MSELAAAEHAKMVIDALVVTSPDSPNTLETLRRVYDKARKANWQTFSSDDEVNAATRNKALLALNDIIGSLQARWLTPTKINKAKTALDPWIQLLKAAQSSAGQDGGNRMTNTEAMVAAHKDVENSANLSHSFGENCPSLLSSTMTGDVAIPG
jgi:hypothetical protein